MNMETVKINMRADIVIRKIKESQSAMSANKIFMTKN